MRFFMAVKIILGRSASKIRKGESTKIKETLLLMFMLMLSH